MSHVTLRAATAALLFTAASAASAADLGHPVAQTPYPTTIAAYAFNWTGAYVGANIGANFTNMSLDTGGNNNSTAFIGGLQAGYLWQVNQLVYGLEGDVDFGDNRKSTTLTNGVGLGNTATLRDTVDYSMSARVRVGYAFDRLLVYGTGGIAFADTKSRMLDSASNYDTSSRLRTGWTLGAGLEYALTNNVTVRGEYLYQDFGHYNVGYTANNIVVRHGLSNDLLRVGVNYKF